MITKIEIENFRCFHKTEAEKLRRVNLITGLNNSGKTAFLEAIFLSSVPAPKGLGRLKMLRNDFTPEVLNDISSERLWNYLFFNYDKTQTIRIRNTTKEDFTTLDLSIVSELPTAKQNIESSQVFEYFPNTLRLHQEYQKGEEKHISTIYEVPTESKLAHITTKPPIIRPIAFIPSSASNSNLVPYFSDAKEKKSYNLIMEAIHLIDKDIEAISIQHFTESKLALTKEGVELPLSYFGDGVRRVLEFVLYAIHVEGGIILFDEIENGIHYQAHKQVWEFIFQIAEKFNVQVFATTHSKEIVEAFVSATKSKEKEEDTILLELVKHRNTEERMFLYHDIESVEYRLTHDYEYRGENE